MATDGNEHDDALVPRLRLIEDQALDTRGVSYTQVYDELRDVLEGGDFAPRHD